MVARTQRIFLFAFNFFFGRRGRNFLIKRRLLVLLILCYLYSSNSNTELIWHFIKHQQDTTYIRDTPILEFRLIIIFMLYMITDKLVILLSSDVKLIFFFPVDRAVLLSFAITFQWSVCATFFDPVSTSLSYNFL